MSSLGEYLPSLKPITTFSSVTTIKPDEQLEDAPSASSSIPINSNNSEERSDLELSVSPTKCWCFHKHPTTSGRSVPTINDFRDQEEDRIRREEMQQCINNQRIEEELLSIQRKMDGFQLSDAALIEKTPQQVLEKYRVSEPNYVGFGVYISSFLGAKNVSILKELNVGHIVIAASKLKANFREEVKYLELDVNDWAGEDLLSHFDISYQYMREAIDNKSFVLVHCSAGVSRSASIVISYIMKDQQLPFYSVRKLVRNARACVKPNRGFARQLLLWERFQFDIKSKKDIYLLWKLEHYAKEAKMAPFSIVQTGLDPVDIFKPEYVAKLLDQLPEYETSQYLDRITIMACKRCDRWLFTPLNVDGISNEQYYAIDRMNWMKAHSVHGKIYCPKCSAPLGSYSLHDQIIDGENVAKFLIERQKVKEVQLGIKEILFVAQLQLQPANSTPGAVLQTSSPLIAHSRSNPTIIPLHPRRVNSAGDLHTSVHS